VAVPDTLVTVSSAPVALSRNEPAIPEVCEAALEIKHLYIDAIAAARELIYVENQYFSSQAVYRALLDRMNAEGLPKLNLVMILPCRLPSWIEAGAMGSPRLAMLNGLRTTASATGHRLGVYYPAAAGDDSGEVTVLIHSKLMIVDDRFLTVGSANLSNRSMGLDTELNVSWEASPRDEDLRRSIRNVRENLLAEHCGTLPDPPDLGRNSELVDRLDGIVESRSYRLRHVTRDGFIKDREWLETLEALGLSFDPDHPLNELSFESIGVK
jgi:phosphatidylserine/phosphatidylglycerophosphate/cardiolipin synthase-like enzyme